MLLGKVNWKPGDKQLRNFGKIALAATVILAILFHIIKGLAVKWCLLIFAAGLLIYCCSKVSTKITKQIYVGLTLLTLPIGITVGFVLMAVFYYLVITPVGMIFRLIGRDILQRRFDNRNTTYWIPHNTTNDTKRYFQQF